MKDASRSTFHYCYWCKDKRTEQQHRRGTGSDVWLWVPTWCRGRPTVHPAAGCGPCWGWSGPGTSAVCARDSTRCLRFPAGSPACRETARSRTSNPPDGTKTSTKTHHKTQHSKGLEQSLHSRTTSWPHPRPATAPRHCDVRAGPGSCGKFRSE